LLCNKISYSFTAHASNDLFTKPTFLSQKIKNALFVVTISRYNERYINLLTDYKFENKLKVIYNGVDVKEGIVLKENQSNSLKILSVGSFTYCKGFNTLIEAIDILKNKGYKNHLTIIGDGKQKPFINEFIQKKKLDDEVKLLGYKDNSTVLKYMEESDLFVLASEIYINGRRDGIPTVCTEAMALGVPVISTLISGIPELILNNEDGILVLERNSEELSNAIEKLIINPALRSHFAINGHNKVLKLFNIQNTSKQLGELFLSV
jgi:glycosyltransferase involved in cell wall biosynthesis